MNEKFDKFTERARGVLSLAQEEAQRFNHNYIGTEHLLLGLIREEDGVAARVLDNLGVELNKVRSAVEFIIGRGDRLVLGDIGLTPRSKKVIELAVDEARRLNHHYIGTEHLLLGLVREGEGIAAGVLESLGVNLEKVRDETAVVLSLPRPPDANVRDERELIAMLRSLPLIRSVGPRERLISALTLACRDVAITAAFYVDYLDATDLDLPALEVYKAMGAERLLRLPFGVPLLALRPARVSDGEDDGVDTRDVGGVELSFFTYHGDALWAAMQARDAPRLSPISEVPNASGAKMFTLTDPDGRRLRIYGMFGG